MQHRSLRVQLVVASAVVLCSATAHAHAHEQLVMPYRCSMVAGKPVLTPSDETGYRVVGVRDQKRVKSCSPVDPKRCLQWTAFKFDIDCGGTRVAWLDVVANAAEFTSRRTWLQNGKLRVQTTPPREKRLEHGCEDALGPEWNDGRTTRRCDDRYTVESPAAVDMPPGYAPSIGLDVVFLGDKLGDDPAAPAAKPATNHPPAAVTAKSIPAKAPIAAADASAPADAQPHQEQQPAAPPPAALTRPAPAEFPPAGAPVPTATTKGDVPNAVAAENPTILNAPPRSAAKRLEPAPGPAAVDHIETASVEAPPQPAEPTPSASTQETAVTPPSVAPTPITRMPAPPVSAGAPRDEVAATQAAADRPLEIAASDAVADASTVVSPHATAAPGHTVAFGVGALAAAALILTLLAIRRFGRARVDAPAASRPPTPARDPHFYDELASSLPTGPRNALIVTPTQETTLALTRAEDAHRHRAATMVLGDQLPTSKSEALRILGMGVASEGSLVSLKKIVDGLRMNWHPDLAQDEPDRRIRELRLKQINAAWEILGGKTAGV